MVVEDAMIREEDDRGAREVKAAEDGATRSSSIGLHMIAILLLGLIERDCKGVPMLMQLLGDSLETISLPTPAMLTYRLVEDRACRLVKPPLGCEHSHHDCSFVGVQSVFPPIGLEGFSRRFDNNNIIIHDHQQVALNNHQAPSKHYSDHRVNHTLCTHCLLRVSKSTRRDRFNEARAEAFRNFVNLHDCE